MAKVIAEAKESDKHKDDVECMALLGGHLFTGDYGGTVKVGTHWVYSTDMSKKSRDRLRDT